MAARPDDPALLRALLDQSPVITALIGDDGTVRWASAAVERILGYTVEEVLGTNLLEYIDLGWDAEALESIGAALGSQGLRLPTYFRALHRDGHGVICEAWANSQLHDPAIAGLVVSIRRWDELTLLEEALVALGRGAPTEEVLSLLAATLPCETLEGAGALLWGVGDGPPEAGPPGARPFARVRATEGVAPALVGLAPLDADVEPPWVTAFRTGTTQQLDVAGLPAALRGPAEAAGWNRCWAWPIVTSAGVEGCVAVWRHGDEVEADHTRKRALDRIARVAGLAFDRDRSEQALRHAAAHDDLTGLANRAAFYDALVASLDAAASSVGVLFCDLDGFKPVNDRLGHAAGDRALQIVATRLAQHVRDTDVVARVGGDEFAVLCPRVSDVADLERLAARLVEALAEPIELDGERVRIGVSIGIGTGDASSSDADAVVELADAALYEVKSSGKGGWRIASS